MTKKISYCREYANKPNSEWAGPIWWSLDEDLNRLYPSEDGGTQLQRLFEFFGGAGDYRRFLKMNYIGLCRPSSLSYNVDLPVWVHVISYDVNRHYVREKDVFDL